MSHQYGQLNWINCKSGTVQIFPLKPGYNIVGSSLNVTIRLQEDGVLPTHFSIEVKDNKMAFISTYSIINPTHINEKVLRKGKSQLLQPSDVITFGKIKMTYDNVTLDEQNISEFKKSFIKSHFFTTPGKNNFGLQKASRHSFKSKTKTQPWKWDVLDKIILPSSPLAQEESAVSHTPQNQLSKSMENLMKIASRSGNKKRTSFILQNERSPLGFDATLGTNLPLEEGISEDNEKFKTPKAAPFFAPLVRSSLKKSQRLSFGTPDIVDQSGSASRITSALKAKTPAMLNKNRSRLRNSTGKNLRKSRDVEATLSVSFNILGRDNSLPKLTRSSLKSKSIHLDTLINLKPQLDESEIESVSSLNEPKRWYLRNSSTPKPDKSMCAFIPKETPLVREESFVSAVSKSSRKEKRRDLSGSTFYEDTSMTTPTVTSNSFVYESPSNFQQKDLVNVDISGVDVLDNSKENLSASVAASDDSDVKKDYWSPVYCSSTGEDSEINVSLIESPIVQNNSRRSRKSFAEKQDDKLSKIPMQKIEMRKDRSSRKSSLNKEKSLVNEELPKTPARQSVGIRKSVNRSVTTPKPQIVTKSEELDQEFGTTANQSIKIETKTVKTPKSVNILRRSKRISSLDVQHRHPFNVLTDITGKSNIYELDQDKSSSKSDKKQTRKTLEQNISQIKQEREILPETPRDAIVQLSQVTSVGSLKSIRQIPLRYLTDTEGVTRLLNTPEVLKECSPLTDFKNIRSSKNRSPYNDLTDVRGVKRITKTPKPQKEPRNDLLDVVGVKQLFSTPKEQNPPNNDLSDVRGVKRMMKTPKVQKEPHNDLSNIIGVKKLYSTPKEQRSPNNSLTDVRGVKRTMKTPKPQKEPRNNLDDLAGVEQLYATPKEHLPNDAQNVRIMTKTPKLQKEQRNSVSATKLMSTSKNDLTSVRTVKRTTRTSKPQKEIDNLDDSDLYATPKDQPSPHDDYADVHSEKVMTKTPKLQKEQRDDVDSVSAAKQLFGAKRTSMISKRQKDLVNQLYSTPEDNNNLTNVQSAKRSTKTPKIQKEEQMDIDSVSEGNQSFSTSTKGIRGVKRMTRTPKPQQELLDNLEHSADLASKDDNNDLTEVLSATRMTKTPEPQKKQTDIDFECEENELFSTSMKQNSNRHNLMSIRGVKRTTRTPKPQKEPPNDLDDLVVVEQLYSTPTDRFSNNDLTGTRGVKRMSRTPKSQQELLDSLEHSASKNQHSPNNVLTEVQSAKRITKTPQPQKEQTEIESGENESFSTSTKQHSLSYNLMDTRDVKRKTRTPKRQDDLAGVEQLYSTPKDQFSNNALTSTRGVRRMTRTPKPPQELLDNLEHSASKDRHSPNNVLTEVQSAKRITKTPQPQKEQTDIESDENELFSTSTSQHSLSYNLMGTRDVKRKTRTPKCQNDSPNNFDDLAGVEQLYSTPKEQFSNNALTSTRGVRRITRTPKPQQELLDNLEHSASKDRHSPNNVLTEIQSAKRMTKTPQPEKEQTYIESDENELFSTSTKQHSLSYNLMGTRDVKRMTRTPKPLKETFDNLDDSAGAKQTKIPQSQKEGTDIDFESEENLLFSTSNEQHSFSNDLTVNGVIKRKRRTPKLQKEPRNDLLNIPGVKQLFSTPKEQNPPNNDLSDVRGVKRLMKTPKVQKEPHNDLSHIIGVKKLYSTPKEQRSPNNNLSDVRGVKRIMKTPKIQKEPQNDLSRVVGVKQLYATPKQQHSPNNDLTDVRGVKRMLKTPKMQKEPYNDLSDLVGVKQLYSTPKEQRSPTNDLTDVRGVKVMMRTPKPYKELRYMDDLTGVEQLFATPKDSNSKRKATAEVHRIAKKFKSSETHEVDYTNVIGVKRMFAEAEANYRATTNLSGVADLFCDKFDKLVGKSPVRSYPGKTSFTKLSPLTKPKSMLNSSVGQDSHVERWVKDQNKAVLKTSTPINIAKHVSFRPDLISSENELTASAESPKRPRRGRPKRALHQAETAESLTNSKEEKPKRSARNSKKKVEEKEDVKNEVKPKSRSQTAKALNEDDSKSQSDVDVKAESADTDKIKVTRSRRGAVSDSKDEIYRSTKQVGDEDVEKFEVPLLTVPKRTRTRAKINIERQKDVEEVDVEKTVRKRAKNVAANERTRGRKQDDESSLILVSVQDVSQDDHEKVLEDDGEQNKNNLTNQSTKETQDPDMKQVKKTRARRGQPQTEENEAVVTTKRSREDEEQEGPAKSRRTVRGKNVVQKSQNNVADEPKLTRRRLRNDIATDEKDTTKEQTNSTIDEPKQIRRRLLKDVTKEQTNSTTDEIKPTRGRSRKNIVTNEKETNTEEQTNSTTDEPKPTRRRLRKDVVTPVQDVTKEQANSTTDELKTTRRRLRKVTVTTDEDEKPKKTRVARGKTKNDIKSSQSETEEETPSLQDDVDEKHESKRTRRGASVEELPESKRQTKKKETTESTPKTKRARGAKTENLKTSIAEEVNERKETRNGRKRVVEIVEFDVSNKRQKTQNPNESSKESRFSPRVTRNRKK